MHHAALPPARVGLRRGRPQGWAGSSGAEPQRRRSAQGGGALLLCLFLLACSPEATRARGGGPGADVGNHGDPVEIHGRTDPSHDTPRGGRATNR